ncbi:hypothetical protein MCAMS1_02033 [biofilm metagenome]
MANELINHLETTPEWAKLNAYERTKRCCLELTKRGERIPSWIIIRNFIGKGSSNDINRGKRDFRQEHGSTLRKITGFTESITGGVAAQPNNLWVTATSYAHNGLEEQIKKLRQQTALAELTIARLENECAQALTHSNRLNDEITRLKDAAEFLKANAACERLARARAEHLLETQQQEISEQRGQLINALDNSQKELKAALSRLEGTENHVLLEIDRVKTDTQKKNDMLETRHRKEIQAKVDAIKNLEHKFQLQSAYENENRQKTILLEQDNRVLNELLQRAEALIDNLSADNSQLLTAIKQLSNK